MAFDDKLTHALVVDDQPSTAMLVQAMLARAGFHVDKCSNGREATLAMAATNYDLVVLDVNLPDGSALDLMREWDAKDLPPVIGMTSGATPQLVESAMQVGMTRILEKPVSGAQLIASAVAAIHDARTMRIHTCDGPPLDAEVLEYARASGDETFFAEFINQALADAWQCLSLLESDSGHRFASWVQHLHTLDGVARSLGARRLTHLLADAVLMPEAQLQRDAVALTMQCIDLMSEVQHALDEWLRQHGVPDAPGSEELESQATVEELSVREREVLRWIAVGKTTAEIASMLGIAGRTVTYHTSNILLKLGSKNKAQAVAKAMVLGWIH